MTGYPKTLKFEKATVQPEEITRISLKAKDVILNALIGHLLGNLSNKRMLIHQGSGKKDALGISLPDDFCIRYASTNFVHLPLDFDDEQSVALMLQAYDTMCDMGDAYSQNDFERTCQKLLEQHAHVP